jgi:hypothetical protein
MEIAGERPKEQHSNLCRTYGAPDFLRFFPGLPAWASLCRAYGAGVAIFVGERAGETPALLKPCGRRLGDWFDAAQAEDVACDAC